MEHLPHSWPGEFPSRGPCSPILPAPSLRVNAVQDRQARSAPILTPNLTRTREETPHVKAEREETELLGYRSEFFLAGSCRASMCPWAHERSGNAAELEEQPLRPLFLLLFPSLSVPGVPAQGGTDPMCWAKSPPCTGSPCLLDGIQSEPHGILLCSLTCSCCLKGEPDPEL